MSEKTSHLSERLDDILDAPADALGLRGLGHQLVQLRPKRGGAAAAPAGRGAIGAAAPRRPDRNLITIQVRHDTVRVELGQRGGGREEATRPV